TGSGDLVERDRDPLADSPVGRRRACLCGRRAECGGRDDRHCQPCKPHRKTSLLGTWVPKSNASVDLGTRQCRKYSYGSMMKMLSPVTCLWKLTPRAFTLTPSLVPGGACPPGSWIWQFTSYSPSDCSPVDEVAWTAKSARPPHKFGGSVIGPSGVVTSPHP